MRFSEVKSLTCGQSASVQTVIQTQMSQLQVEPQGPPLTATPSAFSTPCPPAAEKPLAPTALPTRNKIQFLFQNVDRRALTTRPAHLPRGEDCPGVSTCLRMLAGPGARLVQQCFGGKLSMLEKVHRIQSTAFCFLTHYTGNKCNALC